MRTESNKKLLRIFSSDCPAPSWAIARWVYGKKNRGTEGEHFVGSEDLLGPFRALQKPY